MLKKYPYFLAKSPARPKPSRSDIHLLNAWRPSTLQSYNSAVKRMIDFLQKERRWSGLPLSKEDIWEFCLGIGHTMDDLETVGVTAATLQRYVFAIRAWHTYHGKQYPDAANRRVELILRACGQADVIFPQRQLKKAVHI
jgi:site-specific recombinase XerD